MKKRFGIYSVIVIGIVIFSLSSCMSVQKVKVSVREKSTPGKFYTGIGKSGSFLEAINRSKMDAVRKAVIDMIGPQREAASHQKLKEVIYDSHNPNAFVFTDTFKITRKDKIGSQYVVECRVSVNIQAVKDTLRANGLLESSIAKGAKATNLEKSGNAGSKKVSSSGLPVEETPSAEGLTTQEKALIYNYIKGMTYMVYFNEENGKDTFYMKAAVSIANEYLAQHSIEAVDMEQIEKIKKDERDVYEEETGESISIIQWIAQKLNADVYIEIDGETSGEVSGDGYYGQASVTLKLYDPSTGRLLGSVPWNSPRTYSDVSERAARINAIQASVYKAMPIAIKQAESYMLKSLRNGIPYSVTIQDTPDSRLMSRFRRKLKTRVKAVKTLYQSARETKYRVYFWGEIEDLVDIIFDISETIPGLENMEQVMLRGNSVIFNTGM